VVSVHHHYPDFLAAEQGGFDSNAEVVLRSVGFAAI